MGILSDYEPKKVLEIFEEICSIPHGSGNCKAISEYCLDFAKKRGLECWSDEAYNVVIVKEATPGYEDADTVILQGHTDMVCEKSADSDIDLTKDGLRLKVEDGWLSAEGTTLGADNGIAVAMALAVLDSDDINHPRIEVVLTSDEEIGLDGAKALDTSKLRGKKLLNIDSEEEGFLTVSCAGGARAQCTLEVTREKVTGCVYDIEIGGLLGGHSGLDIDKGRASTNQLMGRILNDAANRFSFRIASLHGGTNDNVIAGLTTAKIVLDEGNCAQLEELIDYYDATLKKEYALADPGVYVKISKCPINEVSAVTAEQTNKIIAMLFIAPQGVFLMSMDIKGLVQTSLNMGVADLTDNEMHTVYSVRSSVLSQKNMLIEWLQSVMKQLGGSAKAYNEYPAWEYNRDSELRKLMVGVYREQYGKDCVITATHGGLECGIFCGKMPGLDCISFGPDIRGAHGIEERADIASIARVWEYLLKVLSRCK